MHKADFFSQFFLEMCFSWIEIEKIVALSSMAPWIGTVVRQLKISVALKPVSVGLTCMALR